MSQHDIRQRALEAHMQGDRQQLRELIAALPGPPLDDPLLVQLVAMNGPGDADAQALLAYAAHGPRNDDASAFFNVGVEEQAQGRTDRAVLSYQQAQRLDPGHHGALNNLSDLLRLRHRTAEARQCMDMFLEARGNPQGLELRFAKICDNSGDVAGARQWFEAAIKQSGNDPHVVWERTMQQLRDEEFAAGWQGYEWRRTLFDHATMAIVRYSCPEWQGELLAGQSILVHREQGLGDTIMFASCLADLPTDRADLHLAVQPELVRLFAANFPAAQVWPSVSRPGMEDESAQDWLLVAGPIDRHIPIGTLPLHLRSDGFPQARAYLSARAEDVEQWRNRLEMLMPGTGSGPELRVGLVSAARGDDSERDYVAPGVTRSVPGALLHPFNLDGVSWVGLHNQANAADLADMPLPRLLDTSPWPFDMADTAALIACLDVVVAVDTAVAHLAAAMGKKVILMLCHDGDWRWGRSRADSYWYPDVTIVRQEHMGDWSPVIAEVVAHLKEARDIAGRRKRWHRQ